MSQNVIRNPFADSALADSWWLKRRSPGGRVAHYIDPSALVSVCGASPKFWEVAPEHLKLKICQKCVSAAKRLRWE